MFEIIWMSSDTCGNSTAYHVGYVEFPSLAAAKKEFPNNGDFAHYEVVEPLIEDPATLHRRREKNVRNGTYL